MSFKLPNLLQKKKEEWYELQHVTYKGERIHPSSFEDRSVTSEQLDDMRMNSYGREEMFAKYTDEVLIDRAKYYISNCNTPRYPCSTYDEALIHNIVPELIKRLESPGGGRGKASLTEGSFWDIYGMSEEGDILECVDWDMQRVVNNGDYTFMWEEEWEPVVLNNEYIGATWRIVTGSKTSGRINNEKF